MLRTFHPIGQGGFYTERFYTRNFTVIYDCGTSTDLKILINEINNAFKYNHTIDALFISHLHSDHVNGLDYLLNHYNVKKVFLPLLTEEEKIYTLIDIFYNKNSTIAEQLLTNPEKFINDRASIVYIKPSDEDDKIILKENNVVYINDIISNEIIVSGSKICFNEIKNWFFIPFNFRHNKRAMIFKNKLNSQNINLNTIDDVKKYLDDEKSKNLIINIYKQIQGDLNTNSLTLYSGPLCNSAYKANICQDSNYYLTPLPNNFQPGCLYLGDYDASGKSKWKLFENKYDVIWKYIGVIQLPHHGSKHNYNKQIIRKKRDIISLISAGHGNKFRHPHASVIKDIICENSLLRIIDENSNSRLMVCIK